MIEAGSLIDECCRAANLIEITYHLMVVVTVYLPCAVSSGLYKHIVIAKVSCKARPPFGQNIKTAPLSMLLSPSVIMAEWARLCGLRPVDLFLHQARAASITKLKS